MNHDSLLEEEEYGESYFATWTEILADCPLKYLVAPFKSMIGYRYRSLLTIPAMVLQ